MDNRLPLGAEHDPRAPYNQHEPEFICKITLKDDFTNDDEVVFWVDWYVDGKKNPLFKYNKYGLESCYSFEPSEVKHLNTDEITELIIEKAELA